MFCPECRKEYVEGIICKDCGVLLVPELLKEPSSQYIEFEEILATFNAGDIAMIKSILESEGIDFYFQGEFSYYAETIPRLMVRRDQAEKAVEILKNLRLSYTKPPEHKRYKILRTVVLIVLGALSLAVLVLWLFGRSCHRLQ